jgi:steroid 5-alpha reductase family enzyme
MLSTTLFSGLLPFAAIVLLGLCLVVSAIGFYRVVYFISIGYGFSVAIMALVVLGFARGAVDWISWAQALLLAAYGLRLGIYLARRERNAAYRATQDTDGDRDGSAGFGIKLVIWISVSALYVCMFMPALARVVSTANGGVDPLPVLSIVGICVMACGIVIEAVADAQKSRAKRAAPSHFCDSGIYRIVRSPNYFGELLVWTGSLVAGAALLNGWLAWVLSVIGYVCIVLIMIGSARRLEIKQGERYGTDPDYKRYVATVPVLLPLLPIYTVKNAKIYLG